MTAPKNKRFSKASLARFHEDYTRRVGKRVSLQDLRDELKDTYGVKRSVGVLSNWFNPDKTAKPDVDAFRAFVKLYRKPWEAFYE